MGNWEYYKENLVSSRIVATFTNQNGVVVFEVYEGEYGFQATSNLVQLNMGKINTISYVDARKKLEQKKQLSNIDCLFEKLKVSCEYFEHEYNKQVEEMYKLFMYHE